MRIKLSPMLLWFLPIIPVACSSSAKNSQDTLWGYTKIDDMEGASNAIAWTPHPGGTPGFWYAETDCRYAYHISPPSYSSDPDGWTYAPLDTPYETFPGILSTHAARLRTTTAPLVGIWGANMNVDLAQPLDWDGGPERPRAADIDAGSTTDTQPCRNVTSRSFPGIPVDLTPYSGLTFWGKASILGEHTIRVYLIDRNSDPRGGICNSDDPNNESACYSGFWTPVFLTDSFARYEIRFNELLRDRWGYKPDPDVLDLANVYFLIFMVHAPNCAMSPDLVCAGGPAAMDFDFWIDDLYFVNR